ncbi:hypothetical protein EOA32_08545 [Mesorhizobium sp. M1A.F.Ca.ET.072.01.1.1]|uniref:hypothetical protein n=1 Tax=Mesorhizobium sp. M1A.F.Ca.ET.072.01.1.1 TaxID=2496753 RepID=UPI000FD37B6F|nr:hypothetical protein [Mesorhizobium sp. M1A.F.Ca.ET.072.01.1.1]RUW53623.1 hypothetical protein EOA32_08545 [Mesorhizobium sp. M1A.F.Ca.ET.072.01.1.1]TIV04383.1 MAG: hypothetical protein E5W04_03730 [Mesorhizobium sp.]
MAGKLIMIIRHAEKPLPGNPALGVDEFGQEDDKSLTVRGWQRAGALAGLFFAPPAPLRVPKSIVASGVVKKDGTGSRSRRPIQTITPLAQRLLVDPDTRDSKGQESEAAEDIVKQPAPVLVCWQHESIPALAAAIVGSTQIAPDGGDDEDYSSIWLLLSEESQKWSFQAVQEFLLPGDHP